MDTLNIVNITTSFLEIQYKYRTEEDSMTTKPEDDVEINFSSITIVPQKHLRDSTLFQLIMEADCEINSATFELTCRPNVVLEFKLETDERYQLEQYLDRHEVEIRKIFQAETEEALIRFFKLTPTQTNQQYRRGL